MKIKKRRKEGKTDYKARINLLRSGKGRIVFRKTNRYMIGQYVKSEEAKDKIIIGKTSKKLLNYGWPENAKGSLKSVPACYLTGLLLGKKILEKGEKEGIFDIGLMRSIPKSRAYGFLKGVVDSGVKVNVQEEMFPDEKKIRGENLKFEEIKKNIEKEKEK